jgi:YD repeat-containing protein
MKNFIQKSILFLALASIGLASCSKSDPQPAQLLPTKIVQVTSYDTETQELTYDAQGNVTESVSYNTKSPSKRKYVYQYNSNGLLTKTTRYNDGVLDPATTTYEYNSNNQLSKVTYSTTFYNDITTYEYNSNGQISKELYSGSGSYAIFEYDSNGNVVKRLKKDLSTTPSLEYVTEVTKFDATKRGIFSAASKNNKDLYIIGGYVFTNHILYCPVDYKYTSNGSGKSVTTSYSATNTYNAEGYPTQINFTNAAFFDDPNTSFTITYKTK